jgi:hypothetical protein
MLAAGIFGYQGVAVNAVSDFLHSGWKIFLGVLS